MNLDQVPNRSVFIALSVKIQNTPTAPTRAAANTGPELAALLAETIKAQRVVDLSVLNGDFLPVWWMGTSVGNFAFPFFRFEPVTGYDGYAQYWVNSQIIDSRTGTHISPPAHYGLPDGFSVADYAPEVRAWTEEFEDKYGKIQSTDATSDKVLAGQLPPKGAFYVFLNPKIENNHGGPGRAIGILPVGN